MMNKVRHPNVVLLMGICSTPPHLSIVTEYLARGSMYRLLHHTQISLEFRRRLKMAIDISKGMAYLHSNKPAIVHRDLKSPNLLVDENFTVKICDFGLARIKENTFVQTINGCAGTPNWMAPEVFCGERYDQSCDVYSFAVTLLEVWAPEARFYAANGRLAEAAQALQRTGATMARLSPFTKPAIRSLLEVQRLVVHVLVAYERGAADQVRSLWGRLDGITGIAENGLAIQSAGRRFWPHVRPLLGEAPVYVLNSDAIWTGAAPLPALAAAWDETRMDALLHFVRREDAVAYTRAGDFFLEDLEGGPLLGQGQGNPLANSTSGPGHQGCFSCELHEKSYSL